MDAMELLLGRHSATRLAAPGPDRPALETMLRAALRAPDHGRLRPWRFIVIPEERREAFGDLLARSLQARQPDVAPEELARERGKALRAPLIVVAAAHLRRGHKIPEAEQIISTGAAAEHVMLAAQAMGFGAMWKTGGPAYDPAVKQALGLDAGDAIVGFLYIGTEAGEPSPAPRPSLEGHVSVWA
ncbi:MAG TPA: nitroreductase [Acetobacteraceae bacterium]|nr:nitroreductase [Acetobacteraceae bacterium]